jgi:TolB-like protein/tetratricopeptide (TPR) repeat protein
VCLSASAFEQVRDKTDFTFSDLGERPLKNIDRPVRLYAVRSPIAATAVTPPGDLAGRAQILLDKPSIAVLPFQNMSGDSEQEYFADGIAEDITTGLSRSKLLFVIARNSSFTYKGKAIDIKQVGRDLCVRYVVEGSVRKAGPRVRITAQLIEVSSSTHIWADHFDGELENIFDFQDQVTTSIIGAIYPRVEGAEMARAQGKPTENLQAYDCYLRALAHDYRFTKEDNQAVLKFTEMANRLDPDYARPYAIGAMAFARRKNFGWIVDAADEIARARFLVSRALELGRDDPVVLANTGWINGYLFDEVELGSTLVASAIQLDPNLFSARHSGGWINVYLGNLNVAAEHFQAALRISPLDPRIFMTQNGIAFVNFYMGRYEEGLAWATTAYHKQPSYLPNMRAYLCLLAMCGRIDEAKQVAAKALQSAPSFFRISDIRRHSPLRRDVDLDRLSTAYRIAGLPE